MPGRGRSLVIDRPHAVPRGTPSAGPTSARAQRASVAADRTMRARPRPGPPAGRGATARVRRRRRSCRPRPGAPPAPAGPAARSPAHPGRARRRPAARAGRPRDRPGAASIASSVRSSPLGSISSWPSASARTSSPSAAAGRTAAGRTPAAGLVVGHQRDPPRVVVARQRQHGDRGAAVAQRAGPGSGGRPDHGGRRAEVVAREIPDPAGRAPWGRTPRPTGAPAGGSARRSARATCAPALAPESGAGALGQAPQDLRLTRRAQRERPSGRSPLTSPMRRTTVRPLDQEIEHRLVDAVDFGAKVVERGAVVSIDGLKLARNGGAE